MKSDAIRNCVSSARGPTLPPLLPITIDLGMIFSKKWNPDGLASL